MDNPLVKKKTLKQIILSVVDEVKEQNGQTVSYRCSAYEKNGNRCNYGQKILVPSNFRRHIIGSHPEVANNLGIGDGTSGEPPTKKSKTTKIMVETDRATIILGTLKLATTNSLPLPYPDWEGMTILVGPLWKAVDLEMSRDKLTKLVGLATEILKKMMIDEMRGKVIHAKIDSASRRGRSFFGINVQFTNEKDCVIVRHLALHEMIERQTKENLKHVMDNEFQEFGIAKNQLLTVAHDNGANMVANQIYPFGTGGVNVTPAKKPSIKNVFEASEVAAAKAIWL
ncbi:hypothetical protein RP20_CCG012031 [Aedes albopictus]|nr:hypothetical protein RP20_CCG012031 [Aedes albopictus]